MIEPVDTPIDELRDLPGSELVLAGLEDLRRGHRSPESLLVTIGADHLRASGLDVPRAGLSGRFPEHELYDLLEAEDSSSAHGRYNSLIRRLLSFERALERAQRG